MRSSLGAALVGQFALPHPAEIILCQLDYFDGDFPRCHFLVAAIVEGYMRLRLNIHAKELTTDNCNLKQFASKTAAHSLIKINSEF